MKKYLWGRRIDEIEVNEIVNAHFLHVQNYTSHVRSQHFRIYKLCHFALIRLFCIQSVTLSGARSTRASSSLLCICLEFR